MKKYFKDKKIIISFNIMNEKKHQVFGKNLLYATTEYLNSDQVTEVIKNAIKQLNIATSFKVNVLMNNGYCKCAYIWIDSNEVANALAGYNLDGSDRVIKIENPNYIPLKPTLNEEIENISKDLNMMDYDDIWYEIKQKHERYEKNKMIDKKLEPLVNFKKIEYNQQQIDYIKEFCDNEKIDFTYTISVNRAIINSIRLSNMYNKTEEEKIVVHNVIRSTNIPSWLNIKLLLDVFKPFVSDKKIIVSVKVGDRYKKLPYPHIKFGHFKSIGKYVDIEFNPNSDDAEYAMRMYRKLEVQDPTSEEKGPMTLIFNHIKRKNNYY